MSRRHYDLPPLTSLSAFEAASRHLSFKNAAQELSVTPGAVSHQIKALEQELGTSLFYRQHRGVELTLEGQALFETLAASFQDISQRLSKIRTRRDTDVVTVGSTTAVAALWLSPAIIRFWQEYPDLNVHQVSQDHTFQDHAGFDFYLRYGRDTNTTLSHTAIYRDELVPVATPAKAQKLQYCDLGALAQERLIHLDSETKSWTTWADWFHALGYDDKIAEGPHVTSYSVALQIATNGAGIALGWRRLVQPLLVNGSLAIIGGHALPAPRQFYLVGRSDSDLSENARKLKQWILAEADRI